MKTNTDILKFIASQSYTLRSRAQNACIKHSVAECNGEYWQEDNKYYTNNMGMSHISIESVQGKANELRADNAVKRICGTDYIPEFMSTCGDPRGIVLKIRADKLTRAEIETCIELGFSMDWGGDYSVIKNIEIPQVVPTITSIRRRKATHA